MDVAKAAMDRIQARKDRRLDGTQIMNMLFTLLDGLVFFELFRTTKKRKYRKRALASTKELKVLVKKRAINSAPFLALLQAEKASLSSKETPETLRAHYANVSSPFYLRVI